MMTPNQRFWLTALGILAIMCAISWWLVAREYA
jgi:hypothetical protein